jgi:hypothetical protein
VEAGWTDIHLAISLVAGPLPRTVTLVRGGGQRKLLIASPSIFP